MFAKNAPLFTKIILYFNKNTFFKLDSHAHELQTIRKIVTESLHVQNVGIGYT